MNGRRSARYFCTPNLLFLAQRRSDVCGPKIALLDGLGLSSIRRSGKRYHREQGALHECRNRLGIGALARPTSIERAQAYHLRAQHNEQFKTCANQATDSLFHRLRTAQVASTQSFPAAVGKTQVDICAFESQ